MFQSLIQGLVRRFESVNAVAGSISSLYVQDLPETYFQDYPSKVNAVTPDDLVRVVGEDRRRLTIREQHDAVLAVDEHRVRGRVEGETQETQRVVFRWHRSNSHGPNARA